MYLGGLVEANLEEKPNQDRSQFDPKGIENHDGKMDVFWEHFRAV